MPLYNYRCASCGSTKQKIRPMAEANASFACQCSGEMVRDPIPPGVNKVERLDNGIMTRAVERPAEVERMMADRKGLEDKLRKA